MNSSGSNIPMSNVLNRLKRSQSLRSLIFGTKSVSKEKATDRQNITNYFDEAFELMPEFSDSATKATTEKISNKKDDDGPQEIKLPWN